MTRAVSRATVGASPVRSPEAGGYLERSERPLTSLVFLLPLIICYEVGTEYLRRTSPGGSTHIIAFSLLQQFFGLLGATGQYLPALTVVVVLLCWHIARNDPWTVRGGTLLGMAVESAVLALPLVAIGYALLNYLNQFHLLAVEQQAFPRVVLSLGAGIYEEMVFRLIAFTLLSLLLRDLLRFPQWIVLPTIVLVSAVLFSLYHYLGHETFVWRTFAFRTVAGVYFGAMLLARGFGITAGSHAAYDVLIAVVR